jgi:hypothetical protein
MQCRTWPFWADNVASPEAWSEAAEGYVERGRRGVRGLGLGVGGGEAEGTQSSKMGAEPRWLNLVEVPRERGSMLCGTLE